MTQANTTRSQAAASPGAALQPRAPPGSNSGSARAQPATTAATKPSAPAKKPAARTTKAQNMSTAGQASPSVEERVEMLEAPPPAAKAKGSESKSQSQNPFSSF